MSSFLILSILVVLLYVSLFIWHRKQIFNGIDCYLQTLRNFWEVISLGAMFHQIIRFIFLYNYRFEVQMTPVGKIDTHPTSYIPKNLITRHTFRKRILEDGLRMRLWVRAHDVMGHVATDSLLVGFDNTAPILINVDISRNTKGSFKFNSQ